MSATSFEQVVAANVQRERVAAGWSQEMLARAVSEEAGREWTRATVASIERLSRQISLSELVDIAAILGCTVATLIAINAPVRMGKREMTPAQVSEIMFGDRLDQKFDKTRKALKRSLAKSPKYYRAAASAGHVEDDAARSLRLSKMFFDVACATLWENGFYDERERRVSDAEKADEEGLTLRALRGHATRQLRKELRAAVRDPEFLQRVVDRASVMERSKTVIDRIEREVQAIRKGQ